MNAVAAPKSHRINQLEGITLTAIFQAFPTFAATVLLLKLAGSRAIVGDPGGAAIFVALATLVHALLVPHLGPKFPRFFKNSYEPLFFDPTPLAMTVSTPAVSRLCPVAIVRESGRSSIPKR